MKFRHLKKWACLVALIGCGSTALAFSLVGPFKAWQTPDLAYNTANSDLGGPMTLAEGYRWNVPTIVYAFDQSFVSYFGPKGIAAVESAIGVLNDLPPVSQITNDGSSLYIRGQRVPTDTKRINFQARSLGLLDVKSITLTMLLEEMGLTDPEGYVFSLRARTTETIGGVMYTNYSVVKLNYDPVTLQPSSYVNGVLYTYQILDPLRANGTDYSDAVEFAVDPLAFSFTSVAGGRGSLRRFSGGGLSAGDFYTGLTHDDVGALRFLLNPLNYANEGTLTNTMMGRNPKVKSSPWIPLTTLTNLLGGTNAAGPSIPGFTNITSTNLTNFVVQALRPGIDKLTFKRGNYDSLIGQTFITITNQWTDRYLSNGLPQTQYLQRAVASPDILFVASDLGLQANLIPDPISLTDTANWQNNDAINGITGQGGPGVITPQVILAFTDQFPFFVNQTPFFLDESSASYSGVWGSFDGTTNAPTVYPTYLNLTLEDLARFNLQTGN